MLNLVILSVLVWPALAAHLGLAEYPALMVLQVVVVQAAHRVQVVRQE
jgi:hypothetical protein